MSSWSEINNLCLLLHITLALAKYLIFKFHASLPKNIFPMLYTRRLSGETTKRHKNKDLFDIRRPIDVLATSLPANCKISSIRLGYLVDVLRTSWCYMGVDGRKHGV